MQPRFVDLAELNLVGLPYFGTPAEGKFTETWHRFFEVEPSIQNRVDPKVCYGVELYDKDFMPGQDWYYFPSVQVSSLADTPGLFFAKTFPACRYAVFAAVGGVPKLGEVFQFIYNEWLPASGYAMAYPWDFEVYGEQFKGDEPESVVEIYIPVKEKAA